MKKAKIRPFATPKPLNRSSQKCMKSTSKRLISGGGGGTERNRQRIDGSSTWLRLGASSTGGGEGWRQFRGLRSHPCSVLINSSVERRLWFFRCGCRMSPSNWSRSTSTRTGSCLPRRSTRVWRLVDDWVRSLSKVVCPKRRQQTPRMICDDSSYLPNQHLP